MVKALFRLGLVLGLAGTLASCQQASTSSSDQADTLAAQETAEAMANPDNGLSGELSSMAASGVPTSASVSASTGSRSLTVTVSGVLTGWTWNGSTNRYEKSSSASAVTTSGYGGTASGTAWLECFASADASGTPQPLPDLTQPLDAGANAALHSLRYHREYTGTVTRSSTAMTRDLDAVTDLTFTGLNQGTGELLVSGTRTDSVTGTSRRYSGTWVVTQTLSGLEVGRTVSGTTVTTTFQGPWSVTLAGSWTGPRGTRSVNASGTWQIARQDEVTVSLDGSAVTVSLSTGQM
jgi:hypothetical protein